MIYNHLGYDLDVRASVNTFYEHINGDGHKYTLLSGESQEYVGDWWNDRISSVRVGPKTLVILFEHRGFKGRIKYLENLGDTPQLFNIHQGWSNDKISSIVTYRLC
ncbi:beta/gamma crystallin domain-containing protein [Mesobacillus zeae]|uniref:Beta/gamma crystallin 'Greek key' domain-containing protein n=1 Tax=Mesobacillus zeae TaxID=1917180 RepID=A0A398B946_9BACI|nr:beta/gamma crystallin domain-containing protein [Mesobacillus zeae]RID86021.1 hypothetical protein D1970_07910 [Mesobacillus zeae]